MIRRVWQTGLRLGLSRTARSLYWLFSGNTLAIILAFFTTILIARFLTKEEFGIYLALYSFAALLADLGDVGVGPALSNFIPPLRVQNQLQKISRLLSTAFTLELTLGGGIAVVGLLISPVLSSKLFGQTPLIHIIITLGIMMALLLFNFATLALSAHQQFRESALINIGSSVVRLLLLVFVAITTKLTLTSILLIYLIAAVVGWLLALPYLGGGYLRLHWEKKDLSQLMRFSGFIGLQKVFIAVSSRLDMVMIIPLAGAYAAGVYGAAARIAQIFPFFMSSFSQVMAPRFAEYTKGKDALTFFRNAALVAILFLVGLAGGFIMTDPLVRLFFPKYLESIPVLRAIFISMVGFVAASPFVSFLIYTLKKPVIIATATAVQLLIIFLANLVFIPRWGVFGPVVGIGLGNLAVLLISATAVWYYVRKEA